MPAVPPNEMVRALLDAITESGGQGALLSQTAGHPRRFRVAGLQQGGLTVWIYIWTVTHGGATRAEDEYRIQLTTVQPPLAQNPNGPTLLMGYYPDLEVFAGFQINRHINFSPGSNSVQISLTALRTAANFGWGFYENQYHEIAVAFRPDQFLHYVLNAEQIHTEGAAAIRTLDRIARLEPVPPRELQAAPEPRRRVIQTINRFVRDANFRDQVITAYGNRCAVTGMQLRLLDAAHILPVGAEGSTDQITNGLSLSPTYHRAFDKGLIYLTPQLEMRPNQARIEQLRTRNLIAGLDHFTQFLNRCIFLPPNAAQRPDPNLIRLANQFRNIRA